MSNSILTDLIKMDGISGACSGEHGTALCGFDFSVGENTRIQFTQIFEKAVALLDLMPEQKDLKITLRSHSFFLLKSHGVCVGVAIVKGHPIVKSVQRILLRNLKKMGVPVSPPRPHHVLVTPTPL